MGTRTIFALLVIVAAAVAKKLPSYVKVCNRSNPAYDECLKDSIENIKPYLGKGISKLKMPPLEPLFIPELQINRDQENIKITAHLKNIYAWGGSNFIINKLKTNLADHSAEARITLPLLYVTTDYDVDGRVLVVPVKGKGSFKGNITDIVVDVKGAGDTITSAKGTKYLQIKTVKTKIKINGDTKLDLDTSGDKNNELITQTALSFYNQNRKQVLEIVAPIAQETAEAFIIQLGNQVLRSVPYAEIIPE